LTTSTFTYEQGLMTPFQEADRPNMKKNPRPQRSGRIAASAKAEEQISPSCGSY
jgi:hypothetical protein